MVVFGVDERIKPAFEKRLAQINDETLNSLFDEKTEFSYRFEPTACRIFTVKPNAMKALFRKNFAPFKEYYEAHTPLTAAYATTILAEMAFIEFADIDFSKWKFLDDYFSTDKEGYIVRDVTPYMIALGHRDTDELIDKIKRYPTAANVLFPALMKIRSEKAYGFFVDYIKTAGLEDSLRYRVFSCFLRDYNLTTLDFFTRAAISNNFARFKSLKEAMTHTDLEYSLKFTADERLKIFRAVVDNDYAKYLNTKNGTHRLLTLEALFKYRRGEFGALARKILDGGDELLRRSLLFVIMCNRYEDTQFLPVIQGHRLNIAELAAYLNGFNYSSLDRYLFDLGAKFGRELFDRILLCFDAMDKINYNFPATDEFPVHTCITRGNAACHLVEIAAFTADTAMLSALESRYDRLTVEGQARFLTAFGKKTKLDARALAIEFLKSDNYAGRATYDSLEIKLAYPEAVRVSEFLKSKKQAVKAKIIREYLRSPDKERITAYLIGCKEAFKREIGEELKDAAGKVNAEKLKKKNLTRGPLFLPGDTTTVMTLEKPDMHFAGYEKRALPQIEGKRILWLYDALQKFIDENKDYEYTVRFGSVKLTIGASYEPTDFGGRFDSYPLWEKVKAIYDTLTANEVFDLYVLSCENGGKKFAAFHTKGDGQKTFKSICNKKGNTAKYLQRLLSLYLDDYADPDRAAEYLYQMYKFGLLEPRKNPDELYAWSATLPSVDDDFPKLYRAMLADADDSIKRLLELAWHNLLDIDASGGATLIAKAYERKLVPTEVLEYLLIRGYWIAHCLTDRRPNNELYLYSADFPYPAFREFYKSVIERCVNAELARGTLRTPYTPFVQRIHEIYGTELFAKATVNMRGLTLVRNNDECWFGGEKNEIFSKMLKAVKPREDESFSDFKRIVNEYGLTKKELVIGAVYNLNFLNFIDEYLGIPGFKSAVLYFAAHLNENLSDERIEKIKEYSTIDYHDFKDGAFDFEWYADMINTIPPDEFRLIYDNAKYVTVAGLHKRAQRFFDALNGNITAEEARAQILKSRNKDFCLIYSLIPIKDEADLFARYTFLSEFRKQSKQFGSQRQLSERRTVDIAFDNLARNAGYADSSVYIYEMESRDRRVIDMYDGINVNGYELKLQVEGEKVRLSVTDGNGKRLASVPSAIARLPECIEISAYKKSEEEKRKRLKRSLEEAMENETAFSRAQILTITEQPLIRDFFERLVLTDGTAAVTLSGGKFTDVSTGAENASDTFRIAHPVTLKSQGTLRAAMKHVIANDIKQPFKQVFREIYLIADGERDAREVLRYKGFNVNLKKAVAALKTRGWGVSEDIGLRKVYYRSDTVSAIFREFDYYYIYDFGDENRELESIMFLNRRDGHIMTVKDVNAVVFSETLRDVDLMIAISANCVYDYGLAMSTFEMRRAMIESIIEILGIKNVSFLKENIKIDGSLGVYVVNIRTGLTFKEGKGNLLIKTIDNYDKPLALDFIDEDPVTADIVTKVLLLSGDKAIKDPDILAKLRE
ncbi:MAG: DUF4132 domain-containing protein [Muribaculaceae bacterium]|nr:DUF4132 domain-containing protein [Muribaculaceae bacterium]